MNPQLLARLKAVKDKIAAKGAAPLPADQVSLLFGELTDIMAEMKAPENAPKVRKLDFAGAGDVPAVGDPVYRRAAVIGSLPVEVQKEIDGIYLTAKMLRTNPKNLKSWKRLVDGSSEFKKAMDTLTASEGLEWVPTGFSPELIAEVTQLSGVAQLHRHIPMPTSPYKLPYQAGRASAKKVSEQTASTGQTKVTPSSAAGLTGNTVLTAVGIQAELLASKNLEEDSIIGIQPFMREELVMALVRGVEQAVINGDTTATHQDADLEAAGSDIPETAWMGYRKLALANSYKIDMQASGNAFNIETIRKVRAKLGKYGINPKDLAIVVSLSVFFKMLSLKNNAGQDVVTTLEKAGPQATIITGQLGFLDGSPLLVSEFMKENLDATGVNGATAADNITSGLVYVHRPSMVFGDRRDTTVQILSELYAESDQDAVLVTMRQDFQPLRAIASNPAVAFGYNISLA